MDRSEKFWNRFADRYSRQPIADEESYQRKLQITREYFRPDMEVLEIGCGTGSTALVHAPYVKHIRAVDMSSRMLEIARGKAQAANVSNITFEQSGAEQLDVAHESIDVVLALNLLHLLENKEKVIAKVHAMLKPGGVFVTSTACIADMAMPLKYVLPLGAWLGVIPTVKVFTADELKASLTGAGFAIDHEWLPGKKKGLFLIAKKAEQAR